MKALRIISCIGVLWYVFFFFGFSSESYDQNTSVGLLLLAFGYALAHAIVSIWQGQKHKIKVMVVLSIIGFALYQLFSLTLAANNEINTAVGLYVLGAGYALIFAIITFILSFKKQNT